MMSVETILVELEFFKALVVEIDDALDAKDPDKAAQLVQEARKKIDAVIQTMQFAGGI
jgi:hypothetical protein